MQTLQPKRSRNWASVARNVRMHGALQLIASGECVTSDDLVVHFSITPQAARKMLRELLQYELIVCCGEEGLPVQGRLPRTYELLPGALEKAKEVLPTDYDGSSIALEEAINRGKLHNEKQIVPPTVVIVRRDPLVEFICGKGRAPSLNFMDSLTQQEKPCSP